jgi:diacylglycerol kinase family enzyme
MFRALDAQECRQRRTLARESQAKSGSPGTPPRGGHWGCAMVAPLPVVINRSGGTAAAWGDRLEERVRAAFEPTGRDIALELVEPADLPAAIARHSRAPVVAVGGGDGTLGTAATQLAGTATALAVLPLGTRNHLARQLGVPLDLDEAAQVAASGARRRMDLGRAGDRLFVNNVSVGIYNKLVGTRERLDLPKWLATVPAAWHVLRTMRPHAYRLRIDGSERTVRTPLLFIGNNRYSLSFGHLGERASLEDGLLSVCAVAAQGPLQLVWLAIKVLCGLAHPDRDFAELELAREVILEGEGVIGLALDGELTCLSRPLRVMIEPAALGIVTPRVTSEQLRSLTRTH